MAERPNIVFFYWDNFGWGELGCYGGGVLRGAPTGTIKCPIHRSAWKVNSETFRRLLEPRFIHILASLCATTICSVALYAS
jgi:hypothetical protein